MINYFVNYTARPMEWIGSHYPDISMFVWAPVGRRQAQRQAKTAQKAKINGIINQNGDEMTWDEFMSMVKRGEQIET